MVPVITVVGPSGVGKTTLLERVVPLLSQWGLLVAVVKHHGHRSDITFDQPGKDTWRLAQSGAAAVALVSAGKLAVIRTLRTEPSIEEIVPCLGEPDLVIAEGFKGADLPKIQVFRRGFPDRLLAPPGRLVAAVADYSLDLPFPVFSFDQQTQVADFLFEFVCRQGQ